MINTALFERLREDAEYIDSYDGFGSSAERIVRTMAYAGIAATALLPIADECDRVDVSWAPDDAVVRVTLTYGQLRAARRAFAELQP